MFQGDQYRRQHPEKSVIDEPCEFGVYSLALKQMLLDNMTSKSKAKDQGKNTTENDSSNGLSSRLDKVKITGEAEDDVNGNSNKSEKPDNNGNKTSKNNIKEKTIIVKDKVSNKSAEVR